MLTIIITGVVCFLLGAAFAVLALWGIAMFLCRVDDDQMADAFPDVPGRGR